MRRFKLMALAPAENLPYMAASPPTFKVEIHNAVFFRGFIVTLSSLLNVDSILSADNRAGHRLHNAVSRRSQSTIARKMREQLV